jgi:hypothetical protein
MVRFDKAGSGVMFSLDTETGYPGLEGPKWQDHEWRAAPDRVEEALSDSG